MSAVSRFVYCTMALVASGEAIAVGWYGFWWTSVAYCGTGPQCEGNAPAAYPFAVAMAVAAGCSVAVAVAAWHQRSWAGWIVAGEVSVLGVAATLISTGVLQGATGVIAAPVSMDVVFTAGISCLAAGVAMALVLWVRARASTVWWRSS